MSRLIVTIFFISLVLAASCSTKCPKLKDTEKGIVAIPVEAKNTSGIAFTRYYKIFPLLYKDNVIKVYPQNGTTFAYSSEMVSGGYNFNRIKSIFSPKSGDLSSKNSVTERSINSGIFLEVTPGAVIIADQKLIIEQYRSQSVMSGDYGGGVRWNFVKVSEDEMRDLIEEFKRIDTEGQWKIANER